jgi:hypothetical protein
MVEHRNGPACYCWIGHTTSGRRLIRPDMAPSQWLSLRRLSPIVGFNPRVDRWLSPSPPKKLTGSPKIHGIGRVWDGDSPRSGFTEHAKISWRGNNTRGVNPRGSRPIPVGKGITERGLTDWSSFQREGICPERWLWWRVVKKYNPTDAKYWEVYQISRISFNRENQPWCVDVQPTCQMLMFCVTFRSIKS